jgi:hypothetical protein
MKSLFVIIFAVAALVLTPAIALGQMVEVIGSPPISQPLVREGTFAFALAGALNLGSLTDEAAAESMLSSAGIAPRNGWIADYPVTPEIVGELQDAVALAADSGALAMSKDEAVSAFQDVTDKYGLSVTEGEAAEAGEGTSAPSYYDNSGLNDYYYDEGPPVVTYYAPPPAYAYLYTWVPYPFWWSNYWFPGFFILGDFDRTLIVRGHHEHFSNHFYDHRRGRLSRTAPGRRFQKGSFAAPKNGFRGGAVRGRRNVTGGMRGIVRWRHGFASGNRTFNVSPGRETQPGQPSRRGTFIAPSGGRRSTPAQPTKSFRQFRTGRSFGRQNAPATVAPHANNMRSQGAYNPSFEGRRNFGGTPRWEGGHSFGGFRGSSGGRSRR